MLIYEFLLFSVFVFYSVYIRNRIIYNYFNKNTIKTEIVFYIFLHNILHIRVHANTYSKFKVISTGSHPRYSPYLANECTEDKITNIQ